MATRAAAGRALRYAGAPRAAGSYTMRRDTTREVVR